MAVKPKVPEQAHQVVGHHDEAERGLRDPKVLQIERVEPEVLPRARMAKSCRWG